MTRSISIIFMMIPVFVMGQEPIHLTLEDAFNRAQDANFQYLIAREDVNAAREAVNISRSSLFPQVDLSVNQQSSMSPIVGSFAESIPGIPRRNFNDRFDALIRARLAVFDINARNDWRISRFDAEIEELDLESTVQDILQGIGNAYLTHWRNLRRLEVIDANLERDRVLLEIARDQKEAGVATPLDVTRAEVQFANNELLRLQQETRVMESALELKRILNFDLDRPLELEELSIPSEQRKITFSEYSLRRIYIERSDYIRARRALERDKVALESADRERLPTVELTGQWGYASTSLEEDMYEQWSVGVGLTVPIFEGFRISSRQRQAQANLRRQESVLADIKTSIESDFRLAIQDIQSRYSQVEVARKTVSLNEREFELARIRFEEGVADNRDVVDAQAALADAQDNLVEAEFQYLLSRIQLARVAGHVRNVLEEGPPIPESH